MDTRDYSIHQVVDEADAQRRGLVPIPPEDVTRLKKASIPTRRAWLERQILTEDERRVLRNRRKAERRAREGR